MAQLWAGKLDRRVLVEAASGGDDGYNEVPGWTALATVWAWVIPSAGKEAREALGRDERLSSSFRVRWSAALAPLVAGAGSHRLRYPATADGQIWDILSATEIGRREGIEIVAVARVAS